MQTGTKNDSQTWPDLDGTESRLANTAAQVASLIRVLGVSKTAATLAGRLSSRLTQRSASAAQYHEDTTDLLMRCSWLADAPELTTTQIEVTCQDLSDFMRATDYPRYYYAGTRRIRYALWHMAGFRLLNLTPQSVVLDVGAQTGVWGRLARKKLGCKVIDVDLMYKPGLRGTRLGANAAEIPLPSESISHIVSFCAFNCFEGDSDSAFVREARRLLRPGGVLAIVPLCIGDEFANLYDPLLAVSPSAFDAKARRVAKPGWNTAFGRWYDLSAVRERILAHIPDFQKDLFQINHPPRAGDGRTCFHAIKCTKPDGEAQPS